MKYQLYIYKLLHNSLLINYTMININYFIIIQYIFNNYSYKLKYTYFLYILIIFYCKII